MVLEPLVAEGGLEPLGGLEAQFRLCFLGIQVAPEDESGISLVGLAEGFFVGIVVIAVVVILAVLPAKRNAPPG